MSTGLTDWQPISTAPRNATWIQVKTVSGKILEAHYAQDYSGEHQPAFDGWFDRDLVEIETPVAWRMLSADAFKVIG